MVISTDTQRMTIKAIVFDAYGTLYDVQSVAGVTDAAFPGHGDTITQIWRLKQLEYTWLRSMMGQYEDFWTITKDSLAYTLDTLGLKAEAALLDQIAETYNNLAPYPDSKAALEGLSAYRLAIFSNGSPAMLRALVDNTGLASLIPTVISVDAAQVFKPDPRSYALVEQQLRVPRSAVLFVSSNGFDISGAKSFGFNVARIERVTRRALQTELGQTGPIGPPAMFKALRSQVERIGFPADVTVRGLHELPGLVSRDFATG
jgi:2-haloacid dehalogenase